MSSPFVAEIRILPYNFAPTGWATCDGQLLPISQNTALFSLLGTFYGGDGKSTFALPDLQGSAPVHQGQGQGLSERFLGETGGEESVTLLQSEIPSHTHQAQVVGGDPGELQGPSPARSIARSGNGFAYVSGTPNVTLAPETLPVAGSSFPHNNLQP